MKTKAFSLLTLLWMCMAVVVNAKSTETTNYTVEGIVTDAENGDPLIGVTVMEKGTSTATMTDLNGKYKIAVKENSTLVFSFIGYDRVELKVNKNILRQGAANIKMKPSKVLLDEVVVVGYSTRERNSITGSVSSVSSGKPKKGSKNEAKLDKSPLVITITKTVQGSDSKNAVDVAELQEQKVIMVENAAPQAVFSVVEQARAEPTNEEYGNFVENSFVSPMNEALSTFSIDVDAASYTNFRRFVNQGQLPPKDAIRVEELINFFKYNYDQPTSKDPVKVTTEVGNCPWAKDHRLVRIGIKAKELSNDELPASNLVFLIDVSGSMYGPTRLDLVKSSMNLLVNNLRAKDRVAIVVYASESGLKLASTPGSEKQKIKDVINSLGAGGSTNGAGGIQRAYEVAEQNFIKGGNNRIILCTDGDFNVGVSSTNSLGDLIEQKRKSGVFLSILGYGMGNYKDGKMQMLAQKGNGNASYIDNLQEANRVLVQEFGGTLFTIAKDVKLQIEFNPAKVEAYRLVGYESRKLNKEDFNDDTKDAGEMGAGHTVTALYEVVPKGIQLNFYPSVDALKYQKTETIAPKTATAMNESPEMLTVKLRYKQPDGDKSVKLEVPLIDSKKSNVSSDLKFASAVAMFAQLLKGSIYKGDATYDKVIDLAKSSLGNDPDGYRSEFVRLVEIVKNLN